MGTCRYEVVCGYVCGEYRRALLERTPTFVPFSHSLPFLFNDGWLLGLGDEMVEPGCAADGNCLEDCIRGTQAAGVHPGRLPYGCHGQVTRNVRCAMDKVLSSPLSVS